MHKLKTAFIGTVFGAIAFASAPASRYPDQRSGYRVEVLEHREPKGGLGLWVVPVLVASGCCVPGALRLLPAVLGALLGMASALLGLAALVVVAPRGRSA